MEALISAQFSVGRLARGDATIDMYALARRRVSIQFVSDGFTPPEVIGDLLDGAARLVPAVADARITAVVDSVFPFDDIDAAIAGLRSGDAQGYSHYLGAMRVGRFGRTTGSTPGIG